MTERPSQNRQILEKLDALGEDMNELKVEVSAVKKQIEMQPRIDGSRFDAIAQSEKSCKDGFENRLQDHLARIKQLEQNQRWLVIAILGTVLNAVMQLILK